MSDLLLSHTAYAEQIELERRSNELGAKRYYDMVRETEERGEGGGLRASERFIRHWYAPVEYVVGELRKAVNGDIVSSHGAACRPIFEAVSDAKITVICLKTLMDKMLLTDKNDPSPRDYGRATWTQLTYAIGRNIYAEANVARLRQAGRGLPADEKPLRALQSRHRRLTPTAVNHWARMEFGDSNRGQAEMLALGTYLLRRIIDVLSAGDYDNEVFIPALKTVKRRKSRGGKQWIRWVVFTDEMMERMEETHAARRLMRPVYLPMVVRPLQLSDDRGTGYITLKQRLVTNTTSLHLRRLQEADMSAVYKGYNHISQVPLSLDPFMVRFTDSLFHDAGGGFPSDGGEKWYIPYRDSLPEPPRPHGYDENAPHGHKWDGVAPAERERWTAEYVPIKRRNEWMVKLRGDWLRRQGFMREYAHRDTFWLTYFLDFRGRGYARGVFTHQMDDSVKCAIRHAHGVDLGPDGEYWLRVHCANCYGLDDLPFDERVAWTVENEALIRDVAADPMRCRWWTTANRKTQMQFVAACRAVAMPDTEGRRIFVQQDASANGVQHWSMMSRDRTAAGFVNLLPSDRPSKFYNIVIDEMKRLMRRDGVLSAAEIDALGKDQLKTPIMVRDYGGTPAGRREHFRRVLREMGWEGVSAKAKYLGDLVDPALDRVVAGTSLGMKWVTAAVSQIIEETGRALEWVAPSGFPVVGRRLKRVRVDILAMDHKHVIEKPFIRDDDNPRPAVAKTVSGAVPDINHSLDASHVVLTACRFADMGIDALFNHDSYWMLAGDCGVGRATVNDQFVETHRDPFLYRLQEWWEVHYGVRVLDPPPLGDLSPDDVRDATYLIR